MHKISYIGPIIVTQPSKVGKIIFGANTPAISNAYGSTANDLMTVPFIIRQATLA